MNAQDAAIKAARLSKDYGSGRGLFDLDLEVAPGEVFGFLGPNGAGKTTTIKLLMGLIRPTGGSAQVFGMDCQADAVEVKRRVGFVPGELPQFGGLRGSELVAYLAGLRGGVDRTFVASLAERLGLDLGRRFREYSRGNKQKLALILAFMHRPDLLILDEPTGGLDPLNQQAFYEILGEARDGGATVFLSSHIMSEVEHVCDRVGIIRGGRLVRAASLAELQDIRVRQVTLAFAGPPPVEAIRSAPGVEHVEAQDGQIRCTVSGAFDGLLGAIAGHQVIRLDSHEPSLEELFLTYYQEARQ
jgi:ABC-2 type transport system ATP-binding protein